VVLQGQSQEPSFPTAQVNQATLPPAVSLAEVFMQTGIVLKQCIL